MARPILRIRKTEKVLRGCARSRVGKGGREEAVRTCGVVENEETAVVRVAAPAS